MFPIALENCPNRFLAGVFLGFELFLSYGSYLFGVFTTGFVSAPDGTGVNELKLNWNGVGVEKFGGGKVGAGGPFGKSDDPLPIDSRLVNVEPLGEVYVALPVLVITVDTELIGKAGAPVVAGGIGGTGLPSP